MVVTLWFSGRASIECTRQVFSWKLEEDHAAIRVFIAATEHPIEVLTGNDQRQPTNELQARVYGHTCDALCCRPCTWKWLGECEDAK